MTVKEPISIFRTPEFRAESSVKVNIDSHIFDRICCILYAAYMRYFEELGNPVWASLKNLGFINVVDVTQNALLNKNVRINTDLAKILKI